MVSHLHYHLHYHYQLDLLALVSICLHLLDLSLFANHLFFLPLSFFQQSFHTSLYFSLFESVVKRKGISIQKVVKMEFLLS